MHDESELHELVVGVAGATSPTRDPDPGAGDPRRNPPDDAGRTVLGLDHPLIAGAPVAIYAIDLEGRVVSWNHVAEELFGWPAEEVLGHVIPIVPDDAVEDSLPGLARLMDGEVIEGEEATLLRKGGDRVEVVISSSLVRDGSRPAAIISFVVDVTEERRAMERVAANEAKWRMLFRNISDTVTITDERGFVRQSTGEFSDVLGLPTDGWSELNVFDLLRPDEAAEARAVFDELLANPGVHMSRELRMLDRNTGNWENIEVTAINALDNPEVAGVVFTTRNATARRAAQRLLADEAAILELVARGAPVETTLQAVADMVADHADALVVIGPYMPWYSGDDDREVISSPAGALPEAQLRALRHRAHPRLYTEGDLPLDRPTVFPDFHAAAPTEGSRALVGAGYESGVVAPIVESDHDDVLGSIAVCFVGRREPTAHVMAVLAVAVQISAIAIERCRAVKHLTHQALHDQLTGLPNRRLVTERLVEALDARDRTGEVGVMLLDLDRFKVVNDSLGHAVGDRLLVAFAERLGAVVRPGDTVGRFEGDEFVVVLPEIDDANDIRSVTNRLDLALSEPFETEHGALVLSASIGTAISRAGDTPEDLVKHADTACSRAKDLGGDRLEVFDDELRTRAEARLHLERDLRAAIERSDLVLHYQPEIDLTDGQVMGAEALLRWRHLERGLILPGEFIALSEETGLINRIGRWVLAEAVHQARTLADRMPDRDPLLVSVNLSALQLSTPNFVRSVETVLDSFDWRPEHLVFEVTESILIDDTDARLGILRQIHELGILIAIDDFGTGFSSLNYLHRFPVDIIKLDRSFVEPLRADGSGSVVAKAVIHLAHDLGLVVTAEGVETGDQLAGLRALGCDWAQGFHFAEGLPSEELRTLIGTDPVW